MNEWDPLPVGVLIKEIYNKLFPKITSTWNIINCEIGLWLLSLLILFNEVQFYIKCYPSYFYSTYKS